MADDLGDETQSSTSEEDDEEDYIPPGPSSVGNTVRPLSESFGGAHPHIPSTATSSGRCKKALPHRSTCV